MDLETKFKKETGSDAYADNDLRPKVPSDYYVEWLEEQLTLTDVVGQSEQLRFLIDKFQTPKGNYLIELLMAEKERKDKKP